MRWGSYLPIKLIFILFDYSFFKLSITSFVLFVLSGLIFIYFVHINLGLFYSLIFALFWVTNKSINLEIFSLSVNNHALLLSAIFFLVLSNIYKKNSFTILNTFWIAVLMFCLYGIKETNLFFFPVLLIFFYFYNKDSKFLIYLIIFGMIFLFIRIIINIFLLYRKLPFW